MGKIVYNSSVQTGSFLKDVELESVVLDNARLDYSDAVLYNYNKSANTFFAVAINSTRAASSKDGITWTLRTLPARANWRSVTYGNNTFVAVAYDNSTTAASSTDGITWTLRTLP